MTADWCNSITGRAPQQRPPGQRSGACWVEAATVRPGEGPGDPDTPPGYITRITPQRIDGVGPWNLRRR